MPNKFAGNFIILTNTTQNLNALAKLHSYKNKNAYIPENFPTQKVQNIFGGLIKF